MHKAQSSDLKLKMSPSYTALEGEGVGEAKKKSFFFCISRSHLFLYPPQHPFHFIYHSPPAIMTPPHEVVHTNLQEVIDKSSRLLKSVPSHPLQDSGVRYVLWSDIQNSIQRIDYVRTHIGERVLFMVDSKYQVYVCLNSRDGNDFQVLNFTILSESDCVFLCLCCIHIRITPLRIEHQGYYPYTAVFAAAGENSAQPLLQGLRDLGMSLHSTRPHYRPNFIPIMANFLYYHRVLTDILESRANGGDHQLIDTSQVAMKEELSKLYQGAKNDDHYNRMLCIFSQDYQYLNNLHPRLFIVLPSKLHFITNPDPATQKFRVHFLCDHGPSTETNSQGFEQWCELSHITDHSGYTIHQPDEFFKCYGSYLLTLMESFKCSWLMKGRKSSSHPWAISFLEGIERSTHRSRFMENIEPLVDYAIAYLGQLSPDTWKRAVMVDSTRMLKIGRFLNVPEADNGLGDLCLHCDSGANAMWKCCTHAYPNAIALSALKDSLHELGGSIDLQSSEIKVTLSSFKQAVQLCACLKESEGRFIVSITLGWPLSRTSLGALLDELALAGVVALELDGITLDIHPQDPAEQDQDCFVRTMASNRVKLITLLGYPRRNERYVYAATRGDYVYGLSQAPSPVIHILGLPNLLDQLKTALHELLDEGCEPPMGLVDVSQKMRVALQDFKAQGVSDITVHDQGKWEFQNRWNNTPDFYIGGKWQASFDSGNNDCFQVQVLDAKFLKSLVSPSLRKLTLDCMDCGSVDQLLDVAWCEANERLEAIYILVPEQSLFQMLEALIRRLCRKSNSTQITLFERTIVNQRRPLVQVIVDSEMHRTFRLGTSEIMPLKSCDGVRIQFMRWHQDHVNTSLTDYSAHLLATAVCKFPFSLTSLKLDVRFLSQIGLTSVQKVLQESFLECLHIYCHSIESSLRETLRQVLYSVPWSSLRHLLLSGQYIEEWIQLWKEVETLLASNVEIGPNLLQLDILGAGNNSHPLSHTSVLFIHRLVYQSSGKTLTLNNMHLDNAHDWSLLDDIHFRAVP